MITFWLKGKIGPKYLWFYCPTNVKRTHVWIITLVLVLVIPITSDTYLLLPQNFGLSSAFKEKIKSNIAVIMV